MVVFLGPKMFSTLSIHGHIMAKIKSGMSNNIHSSVMHGKRERRLTFGLYLEF
jgi:hypothetical protein